MLMRSLLIVALTCSAAQAEDTPPPVPECPVMGEPIDFSIAADTPEGPAYFCCKMCVRRYTKQPEKYSEQVGNQRALLSQRPRIQVRCPVTGGKCDTKVSSKHGDQTVYFKNAEAATQFMKEPQRYAGKLAGSYTYQVICPVMGKPVDPSVSSDLISGHTVYFCCDRCKGMFFAKPADYIAGLSAQGIRVNPKKAKEAPAPAAGG
jgi:YHS domain-containing protein